MIELGTAQIQARAFEEAIGSLSMARNQDPENATAFYLTAHVYLSLGNLVKAKEYTLLLKNKHPSFNLDQQMGTLLQFP